MNASCIFGLRKSLAGAEPERPVLAHDPTRAQHVHRVRVTGWFRFLRLRLRQSKQQELEPFYATYLEEQTIRVLIVL